MGVGKTVMLREMWSVEAQLMRFLEGEKDFTNNLERGHSCDILVNNLWLVMEN